MAEKITKEIFNHMVELAALELSSDEAEYLRKELNNQLSSIDELVAIDIDPNTPFAAHGVSYTKENSSSLREDIWKPFDDVDAIISQAPQLEDRAYVVPDIPHEDL